MTTLITKNSSTAASAPLAAQLTKGELAVNVTDKRLFTKDNGGAVVEVGTNPSALSLPNGTANGVAFLNGSKALTSGSGLTFDGTNLSLAGAVTAGRGQFTSSGVPSSGAGVEITYGQEGAGVGGILAYNRTAGTYQSIIYNASVHAFNIGGAEKMRLSSAGDLGIGTSSPNNNSGYGGVTVNGTTGGIIDIKAAGSDVMRIFGTATQSMVRTVTDTPLLFGTNDLERMRLTSTGLGIGTSSPASKLDVVISDNGNIDIRQNAAASTGFLSWVDSDGERAGRISFDHSTNALRFATASSGTAVERLRLDAAGNLGLGVTPSAWGGGFSGVLELKNAGSALASGGSGNTSLWANSYYVSGGFRYAATGQACRFEQNAGSHSWYTAPSGTAGNAITFTQAMTLNTTAFSGYSYLLDNPTNGAILDLAQAGTMRGRLVGTTSSFVLETSGAIPILFSPAGTERARITPSGDLLLGKTGTDVTNPGIQYEAGLNYGRFNIIKGSASGTGATPAIAFYYAGTNVGQITSASTATAYATSSDYRLKNIDGPVVSSGSFIDALQPKVGTWKVDGSKFVGFIAHEVQEVSPSSVIGEKDAMDEDGNAIMQGMEYGSAEFIANIVAELQSLRKRLAALEGI